MSDSGYAHLEGVTVENGGNDEADAQQPARPADVEGTVEEEVKQLPKQREVGLLVKDMPDWLYKSADAAADRTLAEIRGMADDLPAAWQAATKMRGGRGDFIIGIA